MALLDIRVRTGYLLLAVVLGQIILISAQVNSRRGVPVLETVVFGVISEVQRGASAVGSSLRHVWTGYLDLRGARVESEDLKRRLADAEIQVQQQRALAERSRGLEELLGLRDRSKLSMAAASVIAAGATPDFRTITLDKGEWDGLQRNMAVIAPAGVVGRVVTPTRRASKVQLLIDRTAAAAALIERSRAQGVVVGSGEELLQMEYVTEISDIVQ